MVSDAVTGSRVVPWFTCREDTGQGKDDGVWELYNRVTEMAGCYFVITRDISVIFHPVCQIKGPEYD